MDRKGWIILILCGVGMMLAWNGMQQGDENRELIAKNEKLKDKGAETTPTKPADTAPDATAPVDGTAPDTTTPTTPVASLIKEEIFTLSTTVTENKKKKQIEFDFTNQGGGIKEVRLLGEPEGPDGKVVINKYGKHAIGALFSDDGECGHFLYDPAKVIKTADSITFEHTTASGLRIIKAWSLEKDVPSSSYRLSLTLNLKNQGDAPVKLKDYSVTSGINAPLFEDERPDLSKWFYYQDGSYENGSGGAFKDGMFWGEAKDIDIHAVTNLEYAGVSNQFFTTIIQPNDPGSRVWIDDFTVRLGSANEDQKAYMVGLSLPDSDLVKGGEANYSYSFYMGPRKQSAITKLGAHTDKTMSYGFFGFGAPWMNIALTWIHDSLGIRIHPVWSWGISIVLLTICIRIIIWPLHNKSTRTMKRMSKLQPIMKEIREKHGENPQKVQQETLKLYKKYKVNPMGGCLPMLIQMPIFFAVFGMLNNAVELRGAEFLWVPDLAQQEGLWNIPFLNLPLNILPITMALTMVLQMKMTPSTGDKMQRRIFMLMPILFFFFCYSYASALALYWTVQNIVSIGQTWFTKRLPEPELVEVVVDPNKPRKKGFMDKMTEKMESAQKQREEMVSARTGRPVPTEKKDPQEKPAKDKKRAPKTGGK